jgi:hypothetical protein
MNGIVRQRRLTGWTCAKCGAVRWGKAKPYSESREPGDTGPDCIHDWKRIELWAPEVK